MALELSTIGITLGYAVESVAGTRPSNFTTIDNITSIGEITGEPEQLEVTNLVDTWHRYIEGLRDSGGSVAIGANFTAAFLAAWSGARTASLAGIDDGKATWWQVHVPNFGDFHFAGTPAELGLPEIGVGEVFAGSTSIVLNDVAGWTAA